MDCWFEDHLAGRSRHLSGLVARIQATQPQELPAAWAAIELARRGGHWVALLLDYELGEWLLPEVLQAPPDGHNPPPRADLPPRLTALVFEHAELTGPWSGDTTARVVSVTPRLPEAEYIRRVERIRAGIGAGEFYQINYTYPLDVRIEGNPAALYRQIAARHPVAHAAFVRDGQHTLLSFSPELFVARQRKRLITRPMKGTAPRSADPDKDWRLGQELLASEKNRAENLMIVDLLRNDLGRLARPGTVKVDDLFTLERYPSIWTMTSTVSAHASEAGLAEVIGALFPCGSITGAPKIAAMRRIRQLEIIPRGLYCGSVGWLAPDGDFSLNVAIRSLVLDEDGQGVYNTGGGIVYDSDPALEWQECRWKARILGQSY